MIIKALPKRALFSLAILSLAFPAVSFSQQKPSLDSLYYSVPDAEIPTPTFEKGLPSFELQNPQFNDLDFDNQPDGWQVVGNPELRSEAGNTYARVSASHFYQQVLDTTLEPQHLTIASKVRGQYGNEIAAVSTFQEVDPTFSFFQRNRAFLQNDEWAQVYHSVERLDLTDGELLIIPSTNDRLNWIDLDDLYLLKAGFQNGDLESISAPADFDWQLENALLGAGISSPTGIVLQPQGTASQTTSATWGTHRYFVTADVSGTSQSLSLQDEYLDQFGGVVTVKNVNASSPENGEWLVQYAASNARAIQTSKVTISNESNSAAILDNLTRGYTLVSPSLFNPDDSAVETELKFLFVWPEQNMTGSVELIQPNDVVFETLDNLLGTDSFLVYYDPVSMPVAGTWTARFHATNADGKTIVLDHPFTISEPEFLVKPSAYVPDKFHRVAWTWMLGIGNTEQQIRPVLEAVKEDNFTQALVFAEGVQWQIIADVCEDIGLPFIAGDFEIQNYIKGKPARNEEFSAEVYRNLVRQELGDAINSSAYEGLYIIDEPFGDQEAPDTLAVSKIVASTPEFKRQYLTFSTSVERPGLFEEMQPPIFWTTNYPINTASADLKQSLIGFADIIDRDVTRAQAANRPYYLVGQSFSNPDFFRVGPPGFVRANLGIALTYGIDGVMLFIYNRISSFEGIRDEENQLLQNTRVWVEEFGRVSTIETILPQLDRISPVAQSDDYMWSVFGNGDGDRFLCLVSLDSRRPTVARLTWNTSTLTLQELTDQVIYSSPNQELEIPLRAGDWKLLKFSEPGAILTGLQKLSVEELENDFPLTVKNDLNQFNSFQSFQETEERIGYYVVANNDAYFLSPNDVQSQLTFNAQIQSIDDLSGRLYFGTESFGLKQQPIDGSLNLPFVTQRNTGNVQDLLIKDTHAWTGLSYLGISAFDLTQSSVSFSGHQGRLGTLSSLAKDPNSADIYATYEDTGVFRHRVVGSDVESDFVLEEVRVKDLAISPNGEYAAIARLRRGFSIYHINGNGVFDEMETFNPTGETIEQVVWIDDDLILAGEWDGDVHAARLNTNQVEYLGMWNSDYREATLLEMIVSDGDLIQGFRNGTIRRLGVDSVPTLADEDRWLIY